MQKFGIDLDHTEFMDPEINAINQCNQHGRNQQQVESHSFRNNPFKDNFLFNSPIRKVVVIKQPTPGLMSCLGFTPWTPKDNQNIQNGDDGASKAQLKKYEQLNFEQQDQPINYRTPVKKRIPITHDYPKSSQETPANNTIKNQLCLSLKRTERKRKQIQMSDYVQTQQPKSYRGLRNLASSVRQIITRLGTATAKQIAQALIIQLEQEKQIAPNSKEQQNIKRRVYDALKVLVSAEVLMKDSNKRLISKPMIPKNTNITSVHAVLKQKIASMKKTIEQKAQKAILMNQKWMSAQHLIQRNKNNPSLQNQKISFPFIGMYMTSDNLVGIEVTKDKHSASIDFNKGSMKMVGDIDMVLQIKLLQQRKPFDRETSKERTQ